MIVASPFGNPQRLLSVSCLVHPVMHSFYLVTKIFVYMSIHAIEILRNIVKYVHGPATVRCCWSIHMIATTRQVGMKHITYSIVGVPGESIVLCLRCFG